MKSSHTLLNPHWVTNGIYAILNSATVKDRQGVLTLSDLPAILDRASYPPRMHGFLLDLMRRFEVCFAFADEEGRFLVPELLDENQPELASEFRSENCLNFEYRYPIGLHGLVPRFIVRTQVLSDEGTRWKTGVILSFEGCRALVSADLQERRVRISVKGGGGDSRRRLLAIVRSNFEEIHDGFSFKPEEFIIPQSHPSAAIPYEDLLLWEKDKEPKYTMRVGDERVVFSVEELLSGVDFKDRRRLAVDEANATRVFISYSHKDEHFREELEIHLALLKRENLIAVWQDRRIEPGDDWEKKIDANLERADVTIFLVSADFIHSDYCYDIEAKRAVERHESGLTRVVPIVIRPCDWESTPFGKIQGLPRDGKPLSEFESRDKAWTAIAKELRDYAAAALGTA